VDIPTAWPQIIYKHGGRTDEHVVLRYYTVPEKYTAFESNAVAQTDLPFDKRVVANIAVLAHNCSSENMGKGPNARPGADVRAFID
jgi:hypothetical protein